MSTSDNSDFVLETLVELINRGDFKETAPGVVLTINGLIISGKLISNAQWFEENIKASIPQGSTESNDPVGWGIFFVEHLRNLKSSAEETEAARAAVESLSQRFQQVVYNETETSFIHLKEAQVFSSGQTPLPTGGMLWRGRLSEVSGWTFGLMATGK